MAFLHNIAAILIFAPFLVFFFFLLLTRKKLKRKSIGFSADMTTFLLFLSVPVSVEALWNVNIAFSVTVTAIVIAIILLTLEWKRTKEIEIVKYARKTWRIYFLLLASAYAVIWITGLALTFISF